MLRVNKRQIEKVDSGISSHSVKQYNVGSCWAHDSTHTPIFRMYSFDEHQ